MSERKVSQPNSTDLRVVRNLVWISLGRNVLGVLSSSLRPVPVDLELGHSDTGRGLNKCFCFSHRFKALKVPGIGGQDVALEFLPERGRGGRLSQLRLGVVNVHIVTNTDEF